jgi:hypothetical protein
MQFVVPSETVPGKSSQLVHVKAAASSAGWVPGSQLKHLRPSGEYCIWQSSHEVLSELGSFPLEQSEHVPPVPLQPGGQTSHALRSSTGRVPSRHVRHIIPCGEYVPSIPLQSSQSVASEVGCCPTLQTMQVSPAAEYITGRLTSGCCLQSWHEVLSELGSLPATQLVQGLPSALYWLGPKTPQYVHAVCCALASLPAGQRSQVSPVNEYSLLVQLLQPVTSRFGCLPGGHSSQMP